VQEQCLAFPEIQAALAANVKAPKGKSLPFEQTNRYFRGRILDELRMHQGEGVSLAEIGPTVKAGFVEGDYPWLLELATALERDGLLVIDDRPPAQVPVGMVAEESAVYDAGAVEHVRVRLP
jgi:hypothetical protein